MTLPISADAMAARDALMAAYGDLRAQCHTETYTLVVKWLDGLLVAQQAHMTDCNPARLEAAQTRVKHLISLRRALVDPGGAFTGYET